MNLRAMKRSKGWMLVLALVALPLLGWSAYAQVASEASIRGTIPVTEGADLQALAQITLEEARAAALAAVPGATFAEGELEEEDGYLVYDVELTQNGEEVEVTVDAGDASVLDVERERDDD